MFRAIFAHIQEQLPDCNFLHTVHVVPRCRSPNPGLPQQHYTICCKNLSLKLLKMVKRLPETCWAGLIDQ